MKEKIKVDYLIGDLTLGGAQRFLHDLLKTVDKKRISPRVLYWKSGFFEKEYQQIKGVQLVKLHMFKGEGSIFVALANLFKLRKVLKKNKTDVLQTTMHVPNVYGALATIGNPRLRVVCRKIDLNPKSKKYFLWRVISFLVCSLLQ